jgi:hypothetical protein
MAETTIVPTPSQVSNVTQKLLELRAADDIRLAILSDVMFSDSVGGLCENRQMDLGDGRTEEFPKAVPGDVMAYMMVPDGSSVRFTIAQNLDNLVRLKETGRVGKDTDTWILLFELVPAEAGEAEDTLRTSVYKNPSAADIEEILKGENDVVAGFFVNRFYSHKSGEEDTVSVEWSMISPGDEKCVDEYQDMIVEMECERLKYMFYLDFTSKYRENKTVILNSLKEPTQNA